MTKKTFSQSKKKKTNQNFLVGDLKTQPKHRIILFGLITALILATVGYIGMYAWTNHRYNETKTAAASSWTNIGNVVWISTGCPGYSASSPGHTTCPTETSATVKFYACVISKAYGLPAPNFQGPVPEFYKLRLFMASTYKFPDYSSKNMYTSLAVLSSPTDHTKVITNYSQLSNKWWAGVVQAFRVTATREDSAYLLPSFGGAYPPPTFPLVSIDNVKNC